MDKIKFISTHPDLWRGIACRIVDSPRHASRATLSAALPQRG